MLLALLIGLRSEARESMIRKVIKPCLEGTLNEGALPSSFWRLICLTVRFECGLRKEALEYIRRKWEPMLPAGTFWENYPVPNSELSCSHAWSAHPISHLPELIFVLKQLEANWKKIRLEPVSLLKHAAFFIPLPQGTLSGKMIEEDCVCSVEFDIP